MEPINISFTQYILNVSWISTFHPFVNYISLILPAIRLPATSSKSYHLSSSFTFSKTLPNPVIELSSSEHFFEFINSAQLILCWFIFFYNIRILSPQNINYYLLVGNKHVEHSALAHNKHKIFTNMFSQIGGLWV